MLLSNTCSVLLRHRNQGHTGSELSSVKPPTYPAAPTLTFQDGIQSQMGLTGGVSSQSNPQFVSKAITQALLKQCQKCFTPLHLSAPSLYLTGSLFG